VRQDAPRDHWTHFVAYILSGALVGGLLDLYVFDVGTPVYGVVGGAVIALAYVGFLVSRGSVRHRRS
jgi:hypothetical protein